MTTGGNVFVDPVTEWRGLAAVLEKTNNRFIHQMTEHLFTGERIPVFRAMQSTFMNYGEVTHEGLLHHLQGKIPGELLAAEGGNPRASLDELSRIAVKRQLRAKAEELLELSNTFHPDSKKIQRQLTFTPVTARRDSSLHLGAVEFLGDIKAKKSGVYRFADTGIDFLNKRMGGEWKPKSLVICAASAGAGKTTLVANSMRKMAKHVNKKTGEIDPIISLFISLEAAKSDLFTKWTADLLQIDSQNIISANITDEQLAQVEEITAELQNLPMFIIDDASISLYDMVKEIRAHVSEKSVRVVFLDYLQIVKHMPTNTPNKDLGEVVQVLKDLAKELKITVVVLSQLNRDGDGLNAIRDTGEAALIADVVFFLQQEDAITTSSPIITILITFWKNRFGPLGKTPVMFNGPFQRFE